MTDPRDRLLESALEELLDESEPVDLAPRIRAAWERGERGTGTGDGPSLAPLTGSPEVPRPELRRLRAWPLLGAAAAVLAVGAAAWVWTRPDAGPRLTASRHISVLRPGRWEADFARDVAPGDSVVADGTEPVVLSLPSGGGLTLSPSTVLAVQRSEAGDWLMDLRLGTAVLDAPPNAGLALSTGFARADLTPAASVRASVKFDFTSRDENRGDLEEWARERLEPGDIPPRVLTLDVLAGEVELAFAGEGEEATARSGERRELASHPLSEDEIERTDQLFMAMAEAGLFNAKGNWSNLPDYGGMDYSLKKLSEFAAVRHQRWTLVSKWVTGMFERSELEPRALSRALEFLAYDGSERALQQGRELWLERPDVFQVDHILAFAERGAFEFHRELTAMVGLHQPGDPDPPILPAAYLGLRGWGEGLSLLEKALDDYVARDAVPIEAWPSFLATGAALDALGYADAWGQVLRALEAAVERSLAKDDLESARWFVLATEGFLRTDTGDGVKSLSFLVPKAIQHYQERKGEVVEVHQIRELLREIGSS